jgi:hypothetical protein
MLGFLGLMSGMLGVTAAVSYWISWDIQPNGEKLSFTKTVYGDLADLTEKLRRSVGRAGSHSPAIASGQVSTSATQPAQQKVRLASPALSRS